MTERTEFEAELTHDNYPDVGEVVLAANERREPHRHAFDVRGLVLHGEFFLFRNGSEERYGPGQTFRLARDCEHYERAGPGGTAYLVGRRH